MMPMAGMGQATLVGKLSVPPSWAGTVTPVRTSTAAARDGGLDRRCAAGRGREGIWPACPEWSGRRAQLRRLRCAALRRQAHRHAETDDRLGGGHRRGRT